MNKVDVKAVTIRKQYFKRLFRPTLKTENLFCNGATAIEKEKFRIKFNEKIYIETTILDLIKISMQDFHYNCIKTKYGDKTKMLLIETNSLVYKTEAEYVLKTSIKKQLN